MNYGIIPIPKRKFGDGKSDIVPIRGLSTSGPFFIPENIRNDKVYLVPIIIKSPDFNLDQNRVLGILNEISSILRNYFKVKSDVIEIEKALTFKMDDFSVSSARFLHDNLSQIKQELYERGYRDKLKNIVSIVFTKSSAPQLKITPYYIAKSVFNYEPTSQIITEKALGNPKMSLNNIALGIFTKLGGIPWRLGELIPGTDLIIGVGRTIYRYRIPQSRREDISNWMGSIALVRSDGVFKEARAAIVKTRDELATWVAENISKTINSFILRNALEEINVSIHYSGKKVSEKEIESIQEVVDNIKRRERVRINVRIVHITNDIPHRFLCERFNMYPLSGFYWILSDRVAYLTPLGASLIGSKVYYSFVGIPHTLKIILIKTMGSITPREALMDALNEIHSLTFMHLAGLNININEPVSTKYSRELAYLISSLEITNEIIGANSLTKTPYNKLWFL